MNSPRSQIIRHHPVRAMFGTLFAAGVGMGIPGLLVAQTEIPPPVWAPAVPATTVPAPAGAPPPASVPAADPSSPGTAGSPDAPPPAPENPQVPPPDRQEVTGITPLIQPIAPVQAADQGDAADDPNRFPPLVPTPLNGQPVPDAEPAEEPLIDEVADAPEAATGATADADWQAPLAVFERPPLAGAEASFSEMPGFNALGANPAPLAKGLAFTAILNSYHDTNPFRGYGGTTDTGDDWITTAALGVSYQSLRAAAWTYGASYTGGYTWYLDHGDMSTPYHQANAVLNYSGSRLTTGFTTSFSMGSGASRYYSDIVDQIQWNIGANARYRISRKTSLATSATYNQNIASGNRSDDTGSLGFTLGGVWHYSPLTEFGAGLRYTFQTDSGGYDRNALGPYLSAGYQLSKIVSFRARVGLDWESYGQGSDGTGFNALVGLSYNPSSLWGLTFDLRHDIEPQPASGGAFQTVTGIRLGYRRTFGPAIFQVGGSYETNAYDNPRSAAQALPDSDYFSFDASLGRPVFANRCYASLFTRYSDNSGGGGSAWDSTIIGASLSYAF